MALFLAFLLVLLFLWVDPTSLGRTVPFTPLGGKYGYVIINGVRLNVARWSPSQSTNPLPVTNFNSPQDANGNPHDETVAGVISTQFDITGFQDASITGYHPTAGDVGTGVLGYNAALYFPINFLVVSYGGECSIDGVSGLNFTIKAVGLALLNGRNGGA